MITIITKWLCPYCHAAVGLLKKMNIEYKNIDITLDKNLYEKVQQITGSHTVPQVFIGDIHWKFLWGYTELNSLYKSWELEKLLK